MESNRACRHAINTSSVEALGDGNESAGGPKARKNRFEVLDRLKTIGVGLSPGQMNDWAWFKESWDDKMVDQYAATWGSVFAKLIQGVLEDECSTAFSKFVYGETCRVFHGAAALPVPGK